MLRSSSRSIWKIKRCSGIDLFAIPYGIDPKRLESYRIDRVCAKGTGSILERSGYGIDPGTLGVWDRSWNAPSTGTIPERSGNAQGFRIDPGSLRVFWIDPRTLKPTESVLVGQASFLSPNTRFIYNHARELMRMMYIRWQGTFTLHKNYYSSKVIFLSNLRYVSSSLLCPLLRNQTS